MPAVTCWASSPCLAEPVGTRVPSEPGGHPAYPSEAHREGLPEAWLVCLCNPPARAERRREERGLEPLKSDLYVPPFVGTENRSGWQGLQAGAAVGEGGGWMPRPKGISGRYEHYLGCGAVPRPLTFIQTRRPMT